jgi:hypothetical protein
LRPTARYATGSGGVDGFVNGGQSQTRHCGGLRGRVSVHAVKSTPNGE